MRAYERLIRYAQIHTASSEDLSRTPTTERQFDLSRLLAKEMRELGMSEVFEDEHAYVYGVLPASEGCEGLPCIGLIAHIDTVPDFSGENVKPRLHPNYDGGELPLGESGRVLTPAQFPELPSLKGQTLITTDGTTVLGADFAYTVDGGELEEINFETFNAAGAHWEIEGFNVHPGSAKNTLRNANLVAMEINAMLPAGDVPEHTEGYEGFFHLTDMRGNVEKATLDYIIRDHDAAAFAQRERTMRHIEALINEKYGPGTARLTLREQYRNMAEKLSEHMEIVELAERAIAKAGLTPKRVPVRGGTDGAQLSFRGLLCPNLGTGGYGFHGPYEHITVENMDTAVEILLNILAPEA